MEDNRSETIYVRATPEEKKRIDAAAAAAHDSTSQFMRKVALLVLEAKTNGVAVMTPTTRAVNGHAAKMKARRALQVKRAHARAAAKRKAAKKKR